MANNMKAMCCEKCGAPLIGSVCEYCGAHYRQFTEDNKTSHLVYDINGVKFINQHQIAHIMKQETDLLGVFNCMKELAW